MVHEVGAQFTQIVPRLFTCDAAWTGGEVANTDDAATRVADRGLPLNFTAFYRKPTFSDQLVKLVCNHLTLQLV